MERSDELATTYAPTVAGIQQVGDARARQAGPLDRQVETRPSMAVWTAEDRKTTIPATVKENQDQNFCHCHPTMNTSLLKHNGRHRRLKQRDSFPLNAGSGAGELELRKSPVWSRGKALILLVGSFVP